MIRLLGIAALALTAGVAGAQTIKVGFITSYSGLNGNLGPYMERAVRLYIKQHQKELPPGVKIELITRDDTGPNPDRAKQLAQDIDKCILGNYRLFPVHYLAYAMWEGREPELAVPAANELFGAEELARAQAEWDRRLTACPAEHRPWLVVQYATPVRNQYRVRNGLPL